MIGGILRHALGAASGLDYAAITEAEWNTALETGFASKGLFSLVCETLVALRAEVPSAWQRRVRVQAELAPHRRRVVRELLDDAAAMLAANELPVVLLDGHGLARLALGEPGWPIPEEIDLLVDPEDIEPVGEALRTFGFARVGEMVRGDHLVLAHPAHGWVTFRIGSTTRFTEPNRLRVQRIRRLAIRPRGLPGCLRIASPEHELIEQCLGVAIEPAPGATREPEWRALYRASWCASHLEIDRDDLLVEARGSDASVEVAAALQLCREALGFDLPHSIADALGLDGANTAPEGAGPGIASPNPAPGERYVDPDALLHPQAASGIAIRTIDSDRARVTTDSRAVELNATSASILRLCDGRHSTQSIAAATACGLDQAPGDTSDRVRQTIDLLTRQGILRRAGSPLRENRKPTPIVVIDGRWTGKPGNIYCESRYVTWDRIRQAPESSPAPDVLFFTQFDLQESDRFAARRKVAWMREPRPIAWWTYDEIEQRIDHFDAVLTYDRALIEAYPDKCVYCPSGGCHIHPTDFRIHEKHKLVSFIASSKRWRAPGHLARHEFWELVQPGRPALTAQMLNRQQVDLYGPLVGNRVADKLDSLADYRFQIAIENIISDTYFTEKLIDCFLTGTIPIYRGSRRVADFFDAEGILFYASSEELFSILGDLTPEDYERRLPSVHRNFELAQRYTHAVDWAYQHTRLLRPDDTA